MILPIGIDNVGEKMPNIFNIYCDESCYMENDPYKVFILGAMWVQSSKTQEIFRSIRMIKEKHGLPNYFEIKWVKVSPAKEAFYLELVEYFFSNPDLNFRGLIVPNKDILDHKSFQQTHEEWYYKMYFELLKAILSPKIKQDSVFNIYLDYKDSGGGKRLRKLHQILCNNQLDFEMETIKRIQPVNSKEVELLQLTDLFIGALGYINRGLSTSVAKIAVITRIKKLSGLTLQYSTSLSRRKFNLFVWNPFEEIHHE